MEGPPRPASTPTKLASDIRPIVFGGEGGQSWEVVKDVRRGAAPPPAQQLPNRGWRRDCRLARSSTDSREKFIPSLVGRNYFKGETHFSRHWNTVENLPKKYTSCRVWLGKLHLETFLMNYAAGPTLVTGEGEMRKGNVLFLLLVSSGWIIFFHTICCVLQANAHWLYSLDCNSQSCRSTVWSDWARFCPLSLCVSADKDCSAR